MSISAETPYITVIMPVYNDARFIERSLSSLFKQTHPPQLMEILVIDGMSTDTTRQLIHQTVQKYQNQPCPDVKVLNNPQQTSATALNIGLRHARGEMIMRLDGNCEVPPNYIRECLFCLDRTNADNVGGLIYQIGDTRLSQAVVLAAHHSFGVHNDGLHYSIRQPGYVDTVYLGFYRHASLLRVGGFNESLTCDEEVELNLRLHKAGGRIFYSPTIQARYYKRTSVAGLAQQYFQAGFARSQSAQHPLTGWQSRQLLLVAFTLALLVRVAVSPFFGWIGLAFVYSWLAYVLVTLAISVWIALNAGWKHLPFLLTTFLLAHCSWATGFGWGRLRTILFTTWPQHLPELSGNRNY